MVIPKTTSPTGAKTETTEIRTDAVARIAAVQGEGERLDGSTPSIASTVKAPAENGPTKLSAFAHIFFLRKPSESEARQIIWVLAVALASGIALAFWCQTGTASSTTSANPDAVGGQPFKLFTLFGNCLATGLWEEALFRALAMTAFSRGFAHAAHPALRAALLSSAIFAFLHFYQLGAGALCLEALPKPLMAAAFGFTMAALWEQTRSLTLIALIHAAFDLLYFAPSLFGGVPLDTVFLVGGGATVPEALIALAGLAALVPCCIRAWRTLTNRG